MFCYSLLLWLGGGGSRGKMLMYKILVITHQIKSFKFVGCNLALSPRGGVGWTPLVNIAYCGYIFAFS